MAAAGKPVAINYGGWQAELIQTHAAGIVLPPDDPAQAAHALAELAHDAPRLQQAGAAARHLAQTEFDRDTMAHKLEEVLRAVVERT